MAATESPPLKRTAKLSDLPVDFSMKVDQTTSLKSRQQGFRLFSEGYVHNVSMMYATSQEIVVTAKCYRSQRKSEQPHSIHIKINVLNKDVTDAYCSCQAGLCKSCSHVVGLIESLKQWQLMGFTEVPAHLSCTSLPQQWNVPRGPKIEPVAVPSLIIINPKPVRKKRPIRNTLTDCRKIRVTSEDLQHLQSLDGLPISYVACSPTDLNTVTTHVGPVPIASGLSTHVRIISQGYNLLTI